MDSLWFKWCESYRVAVHPCQSHYPEVIWRHHKTTRDKSRVKIVSKLFENQLRTETRPRWEGIWKSPFLNLGHHYYRLILSRGRFTFGYQFATHHHCAIMASVLPLDSNRSDWIERFNQIIRARQYFWKRVALSMAVDCICGWWTQ